MRSTFLISAAAAALMVLSGCGRGAADGKGQAAPGGSAAAPDSAPAGGGAAALGSGPAEPGPAPAASLAGRTAELTNPDDFTMVLLSYSLSGTAPPIDKWVEDDPDVRFARPAEKDAARTALRNKIAAGLAAVRNVGLVRLTMDASLSDFDPSYNEYTVRALAPSSVVYFKHFGEQVSVKFDNAEKAERWSVDPKQAQSINDRLQFGYGANLDVLLKIAGSTPDASAGTINVHVVSYELKSRRDGTTLARIEVAG